MGARNKESNFGKYFNLPNPGLVSYFARVRSGNSDEYRTPFYHGKPVTKVLKLWSSHLNKLKQDWPGLYNFEMDLAKKVGPMSVQFPLKDRIKDIDSYYESIDLDSKPISPSAVAAVKREWKGVGSLTLRSQKRTSENMQLSTNSGNPYFIKRRAALNKTVPCTVREGKHFQQVLPTSTWDVCAILGWRGQEGGPSHADTKQRVVWMFPFAVNVAELQYYQPAIEKAQKLNLVPAWVSMEAVDQSITKLFDTKGPQDLIVCTDFSKFDQHFNKDMQMCARDIIKSTLNTDAASKEWLENVFPVKYEIPLAYDYGKIRYGKHGMASGSGGTNFDETLAHRALQYEAAISIGAKLNPYSMCLGDDGILTYPGITVDNVISAYAAHGQVMNVDKQSADTQECTYLRRWHHNKYRINGVCAGVYATTRALGRLCEQERYYDPEKWGPKMVALRQLSILENCKYHPLKEEFVRFCMKGDKYRLGLDIPGFLDNISEHAQEAIDLMPDFLGYTKSLQRSADSGIESWWIVQYLKSLAKNEMVQ